MVRGAQRPEMRWFSGGSGENWKHFRYILKALEMEHEGWEWGKGINCLNIFDPTNQQYKQEMEKNVGRADVLEWVHQCWQAEVDVTMRYGDITKAVAYMGLE